MRSSFIRGELKDISLSRLRISAAVRGVLGRSRGLKYRLGDVETDCRNYLHAWLP